MTWALLIVSVFASAFAATAPTAQIQEKQLEITQAEQQIEALDTKIRQQNERTGQLQSQLDEQQAVVLNLGRQSAELLTQASSSSLDNNLASQQASIENNIVVAQLQGQVAQQQAYVAGLADKVRQQDATGLDVDAFNQDRANLQSQQKHLSDLKYELAVTQAQAQSSQSAQAANSVKEKMDQRVASQTIEEQQKAATATADTLQANLNASQEQEKKLETEMDSLQNKKRVLMSELAELDPS